MDIGQMDGEASEIIRSNEVIKRFLFSSVDSMALKCAVDLRIADIMHSHSQPITLRQIIASMGSPESVDITCLERIMRFLVHRRIFTAHPSDEGGEMLFGLTQAARWILRDAELSIAPLLLLATDQRMLSPLQLLSSRVRDGGDPFKRANGLGLWDYMEKNPSFSELFNNAMKSDGEISSKAMSSIYKNVFEKAAGILVDVGGGIGAAVADIVKAHPHIKGINFDLPHIIAMAPNYPGVTHVGGDMFVNMPVADTIFMRLVLHDWSDEDCSKILKNCFKSLPGDTGKLVLAEMVLSSEAKDELDISLAMDLMMMAVLNGGKERSSREWKELLYAAGFKRINITYTPWLSIIEAYTY